MNLLLFCIATAEEFCTVRVTIFNLLPSTRIKSSYLCDGRQETVKSVRVQCKVNAASLNSFLNATLNTVTYNMKAGSSERQMVAPGRLK